MQKKLSGILCVLLSVALLICIVPANAVAAETVESGKCGVNLTWTLDGNGLLTISGEGAMVNYDGDESPFYYKSGIKSVVISNGVTSIGDSAFEFCTRLTSVTIPNSVTVIGNHVFYGCKKLTSVTIPENVTYIGDYAFSGCTGFTKVTIPERVTYIGEDAFENTAWYNNQPNGLVYAGKVAYKYKGTMQKNTSIIIKKGTKGVAGSAFEDCTGLTSVTIPDSVTSIGEYAFSGCTGLTSVTIPDSVTSIGYGTFKDCVGLTSITIPDSVTSIGDYAFSGCTGLTKITIPDSVTIIEGGAFENTAWYNNQPNGLVYAGKVAYKYKGTMPKNTSIIIKNETKGIANGAFKDCTRLTSITIPDSVTSIGFCAFMGCSGLTSVTIPNSVTSIGSSVFADCTGLTSVTIPNSVTSIGSSAFADCTGLTSVTIPDSVTSIGENAFQYCTGLTSVTIPNSVTSIGFGAFWGCSGLTSVTIPGSVTFIDEAAFYECTELKDVSYLSSEATWNKIKVYNNNDDLLKANIHFHTTHTWNKGKIVTPATCTKAGKKNLTCTVCGVTKTVIIPASHTYKNVVTKATLTADGKVFSTCTVCGAKQTTVIAKASKITISKAKFVYSGKVLKPTLTVKDSKGSVIPAKFYAVKWSNAKSTAVGKYTVTVTFKGNYSGTKTLTYTIVPKAVTGVKNAASTTKSVKLSWTKATGAKYYEVYGSVDGKTFKKITTVSTNTFNVTKVNGKALAAGKTYYFKVRALDATKKLIGAYSAALKTGTLTAAPKLTKLTSAKSKTATVTWGKVTGAKIYAIYKSADNKTWTKAGSTNGTSFTLAGLTGGKRIYVKVLAVNAYKANSAYSAVKYVTVKK